MNSEFIVWVFRKVIVWENIVILISFAMKSPIPIMILHTRPGLVDPQHRSKLLNSELFEIP